jgi:hypothetical protein
MGVKFEELSSYYKLLLMFGDYGYGISAEMGKELNYLTKLYLVKGHTEHLSLSESDILNRVAFMLKQFVLARSFKREASKLKYSDKYNCLPIETRQFLYIDRLLLDKTFPNSLCLTD